MARRPPDASGGRLGSGELRVSSSASRVYRVGVCDDAVGAGAEDELTTIGYFAQAANPTSTAITTNTRIVDFSMPSSWFLSG
jgi:hypothetical protein